MPRSAIPRTKPKPRPAAAPPVPPPASAQPSRVLTVDEAAAELGIGRSLAYEAVRRGEIPHIKLGKRIVIPRDAFERMLQGGAA